MEEELGFSEISIKEDMLSELETKNLVYFLDEIIEAKCMMTWWEKNIEEKEHIKNLENSSKEDDVSLAKILKKRLEKELEEDEEQLENCYEMYKIQNSLLDDPTIIQAIKQRIDEIQYDENNIKTRALAVQTIAMLLNIEKTLQSEKTIEPENTNEKRKCSWYDIQTSISNIMSQMTIQDLMIVYDYISRFYINNVEQYREVFIDKINNMTDAEFNIYIRSYDSDIVDSVELNRAILKRMEQSNPVFAELQIEESGIYNDDLISEKLKKASKDSKLNLLFESNLFLIKDDKFTEEIVEIIRNSSNEDIVRMLLYLKKEVVSDFENVLLEKTKKLPNEYIKFLLFGLDKNKNTYRLGIIQELVKSKKIPAKITPDEKKKYKIWLKEYTAVEDLFSNKMPYFKPTRLGRIEELDEDSEEDSFHNEEDNDMSQFPDIELNEDDDEYYDDFDKNEEDDVELDSEDLTNIDIEAEMEDETDLDSNDRILDVQTKTNILSRYIYNTNIIKKYIEFTEFIDKLSQASDVAIVPIIKRVNMGYNSTGYIDKDEKKYINFLELYLRNRVLNMNDNKSKFLLHLMKDDEGVISNAILTRLQVDSIENEFEKHEL